MELKDKIEISQFKLKDQNKSLNYTLSWDVNEEFCIYFDYIQVKFSKNNKLNVSSWDLEKNIF
jgi:hypothetical protein